AKGIGAELRKEALIQFDDEEFADVLRPLIENKRKSLATSDPRQRQQKIMQFALGRGFTYGIIKLCMETHDDSFDEDDV
ncbi:MAG: RecX family transcriptional regulator, partial [Prevotella sp.]|nr:RecX family transcriptional regulator [Prevotella sp.]